MMLANVAWILASNRKRVLVLDWDLEAPGLHRYLHPFLQDKNLSMSEGIIDFMIDFAMAAVTPTEVPDKDWYLPYTNIRRYAASLNWNFPSPGTLDFISAGRQGPDYATRVNAFNWANFYEHLGGGLFLEAAKQSMAGYDYVLIDSRTGVSDTSGVCTIQMPDYLVVCFTLNSQSIEGAAAVAESAHRQRLQPNGEPGLKIFPVPTRVELSEKQKLDLAEDEAHKRFQQFLWHIPVDSHAAYWGSVRVLYHPFYAYEEVLATFGDKPLQTQSVLASMEIITQYLTENEVTQFPPLEESERNALLERYLRKPKPVISPAVKPSGSWIFYVSCSRGDRDEYLKRFLQDISHEVRLRLGLPQGSPLAFFDEESITIGEDWSAAMSEGLRTSRLMISLVSPSYIKSDFCGKEFAVFLQRQKLMLEGVGGPGGILPISWIPVKGTLPRALEQLQFLPFDSSTVYAEVGLRQMMRLRRYREEYTELVFRLAEEVGRAYEQTALPLLDRLPAFHDIQSAFDEQNGSGSARETVMSGPKHADLIFAVAQRNEMAKVRENLESYSDVGGWKWYPFLPEVRYDVGILASEITNREAIETLGVSLNDNLIDRVAEAEQNYRIVVIIVDPWILKLGHYQHIFRMFDQRNFLNCAVLILWGKEDAETIRDRPELQGLVRATFSYRSLSRDLYFREAIQSADEFKRELEMALQAIRLRMIERAQVLRKVESGSEARLPSIRGLV
jgi:FxsC-like protein